MTEAELRRQEFIERAKVLDAQHKARFSDAYEKLFNEGQFLDEDGYPTEETLELIQCWHWSDCRGWFEFIKGIWWNADDAWDEIKGGNDYWLNEELDPETVRYHISTFGWSGNESIIGAMKKNFMWNTTWVQSRRGGHYIFELKEYKDE